MGPSRRSLITAARCSLHLYVDDADTVVRAAEAAGAKLVRQITTVRLIAEQIQLVIIHDAFGTVGCLKDYRFYRGFFKHCHRKHLHQCVE